MQHQMNSRSDCYEYQLSQHQKFQNLMSPLLQVNIDWFAYSRLYLDESQICKKLFRLDSNLNAFKWLCDNAVDNGRDYATAIRQAKLNQDSYFMTPKNTSDYLIQAFRGFGLLDALTIYNRHDDFIECWTFYSTYDCSLLSGTVLNNQTLDIFSKFKTYFSRKLQDLDPHYQIGIDYPIGIDLSPLKNQINDTSKFIDSLAPYHNPMEINGKKVSISKREWECWRLIAIGQSVKGIANILGGISPRTVESYIQNLKQKIECYNKTSLAKLFSENFKNWM